MSKECLMYPAIQKFYSALNIINQVDSEKYIFETIPQIDSFFSEMRNITFVMQKSFNTPELKIVYEKERDKFLNNEVMKWFKNTRNETTKEHPFKLEKALAIEFYLPNFLTETTHLRLTIDNDSNFGELHKKLKLFLDTHYVDIVELYLSVTTTFLENGKEVDIYSVIQKGIGIMHAFLVEMMTLYPCNCLKCKKIKEEIKYLINKVNAKKLTFSSDLYYADKRLSIGGSICTPLSPDCSLLSPPIPIKNSIFDIKGLPPCDISYLKIFTVNHVAIARVQRTKSQESELMPVFLIVNENDTFSFYGPITGTNKSTFYRAVNDVAKIIETNKVKLVLLLTEAYRYNANMEQLQSMKYEDRIREATNVMIWCSLVSKNLEKIYGTEVDYQNLFDDEYIGKQITNMEEYEPEEHMAYPIFQALHKNK